MSGYWRYRDRCFPRQTVLCKISSIKEAKKKVDTPEFLSPTDHLARARERWSHKPLSVGEQDISGIIDGRKTG
ncbi:hypothetical protein TWF102_005573 [Orbilia oligospora]|uniref:Uncharacterized protein n=1 Tax=Orbilia oligospora TaxID=2813651 RepID=A0A7C8NQZ1_ORBOL|nr:hypothetical protein TWF102_005573 [Orbilia oligospora]KAF3125893.1 hypothetical protein TWF594_001294 [Orbilia oligospora]